MGFSPSSTADLPQLHSLTKEGMTNQLLLCTSGKKQELLIAVEAGGGTLQDEK